MRISLAVALALFLALVVSCRHDPTKVDEKKPPPKSNPAPVKAREFRHDQVAEVGAFKIELVRGSTGKLKRMFFGKFTATKDECFQIDLRITNHGDTFQYGGWFGDFPSLTDEDGNKCRYEYVMSDLTVEQKKLERGRSLEDAVAFEPPKADAKEFRLEINCNMIGKDEEYIAFVKIPRDFFKRK